MSVPAPDTEATTPEADPGSEPAARRVRDVERLRLVLICAAITFAVVAQSAGNAAADTKLDLVVSPLRFLGRSVQLWDPIGNAGQLQNQAYGYLFPIGPFFALLHALAMPAWQLQRTWEAALVVAAFLGAYRLSRVTTTSSFWAAVAGGLVYAAAPRTLSELTSISSELMPVAALPWVMLPLVRGAVSGSTRRAAFWSGVALLFAGGVNAAATLAILPAPALWLLTRSRGPRRASLMRWWALAVVLSTLWWTVPLVMLGRYSPPFLDWVESASTTTLPTSLLASLRGVDHWESYLGPGIWPAGWIFATSRVAILATTAVAAAGLIGMSRRSTPHRTFLWSTLLIGLVALTFGHAATVGPPFDADARDLLDGVLVPFRNVHKFDPLVRLPIALGVAALVARVRVPRTAVVAGLRLPARVIAVAAVVAVAAVAVSPVLTNHLVSSQRITTEPTWWARAGGWLGSHSAGARALVVPGSSSPMYLWGGTVDNALQPVATTPWTERNAVPLAQAGYIRLLNQVEARLAAGAPDPELTGLLRAAGIGYVVLANDLNTLTSSSTPLLFVRATLDNTPGLRLAASFGPDLGGSLSPRVLLDGGATVARPAVQIFALDQQPDRVELQPLDGALRATGSSDALPALYASGVPPATAVLFGRDGRSLAAPGALTVTTDGIRKAEASFAGLLQPSATMTEDQPYSTRRKVHDYLPDHPGPLSAYRYYGIADVFASSSGDAALAYVNRGAQNGPWSALDGNASTAWLTSTFTGPVGQWLQVDFTTPVAARYAQIAFAPNPTGYPTRISVLNDAGQTVVDTVQPGPAVQRIALPAGAARALRITIAATDKPVTSAGIATLAVPGVLAQRVLQVPSTARPDVLDFATATGHRSACISDDGVPVCRNSYAADGQEDAALVRGFTVGTAQDYDVNATVRLAGADVDRLLDAGGGTQVTASSVVADDPRVRPGAVLDGDPATYWQAAPGDARPTLTFRFDAPRRVDSLTLTTPPSLPTATPVRLTVTAADQQWSGALPAGGRIVLPAPVTTSTVTLRVDEASIRPNTDTAALRTTLLPVGIDAVSFGPSSSAQPAPESGVITLGCSAGLAVDVNGTRVPLTVTATRADVLAGLPVPATACEGRRAAVRAGANVLTLTATASAEPVTLTLARPGVDLALLGAPAGSATPRAWGSTHRTVQVATSTAAVLVVHENQNAGWQARLDGRRLTAVRINGWEQGFVVPAGARGTVVLDFAPQTTYVAGLVVGAVAVLALVLVAVLPERGRRSRRRAELAAVQDGRLPLIALAVAALVVAFALGAWNGLALAAALGAGAVVLRPRVRLPWSVVGGTALLAGGALVALAPAAQVFVKQNSATVQLLALSALALCLLDTVPPADGGTDRPRQAFGPWRRTGRSTRNQDTAATARLEPSVRANNAAK